MNRVGVAMVERSTFATDSGRVRLTPGESVTNFKGSKPWQTRKKPLT